MLYNSACFYVGSSDDIDNRIKAHETSPRTARHGGIKRVLAPMTPEQPNLRSWEREETISRMMEHGIYRVRGWNYCQHTLDKDALIAIKDNITGTFDLCHTCGFFGHFANQCPTPKERVAGWRFEWEILYARETVSDSQVAQDRDLLPQRSTDSSPTTRECLGCQVDISDRPDHHERCHPCWKEWVNCSP